MTLSRSSATWRTPMVILTAASLVALLVLGLRASQGLFLKPMSLDLGWGRETFAFAMALQNLFWGAFQPLASAAADRWGTGRVVAAGGILYATGLFIMSRVSDPVAFHLSAGVVLCLAQSGSGLAVLLGAVGRVMPPERRSWALGIISAVGAAGQFLMVPLGQAFLSLYGWAAGFALLAVVALAIVVLAGALKQDARVPGRGEAGRTEPQTLRQSIAEAGRHRGYRLLTAGFFVCGFHVAFVAVHLPAYLTDMGMPEEAGAWSLALIGFFNIIGCFAAGALGGRFSKKYLLSILYLLRSAVILIFLLLPVTTISVLLFSSALGLLWLSTVPLTSGLVAQIFGPRYMATLFAFVFFSHQIGSFIGVWLGGWVFDAYGTYDPIWWAGIALGLAAAALHWPIDEASVPRLRQMERAELAEAETPN